MAIRICSRNVDWSRSYELPFKALCPTPRSLSFYGSRTFSLCVCGSKNISSGGFIVRKVQREVDLPPSLTAVTLQLILATRLIVLLDSYFQRYQVSTRLPIITPLQLWRDSLLLALHLVRLVGQFEHFPYCEKSSRFLFSSCN